MVSSGLCLVAGMSVGSPGFLHFRFEDVTPTVAQLVAHKHFGLSECGPEVVVEFLDDLERPSSLKNIAAEKFSFDFLCEIVPAGVVQFLYGFVEHQVGMADQLVKVVQASTCAFDRLESF